MASERQIAANQRNAQKSTGPRSQSAKARSSRNAHRHGLAVLTSNVGSEAELKELARQFEGDADDAKILALAEIAAALAEIAADAQLDLARVRKVHTAMIERALMQNASGGSRHLRSDMEEFQQLVTQTGPHEEMPEVRLPQPALVDPLTLLPEEEEDKRRFAEAVRRILPELTRICRYEKRAAGRRDRAIGKIMKSRGQDKL